MSGTGDPYATMPRGTRGGSSQLAPMQPPGSRLVLNPDGTATIEDGNDPTPQNTEHYANLAEELDDARLNQIASDLLDAIEQDEEAQNDRDKQYAEGLNRTGLGDVSQGGANFPGASRAVSPLLTEAAIDFGARTFPELWPAEGPAKAAIEGDENDEKVERSKRVARWLNYQLNEEMMSAANEFETGLPQCSLGGAFYTKFYTDNGKPQLVFIPRDHIIRPATDGDIYNQVRITHRQEVDRWTFRENVNSGLWLDVVDYNSSSETPEKTQADESNAKIIGQGQPNDDVDRVRRVYETSVIMGLQTDDAPLEPYLVTIDHASRKVLSIYRNWDEEATPADREDFVIEFPFQPWRGGQPIGMTQMIGKLSGAATGALRALLDAGHLNNTQTGVQLKGGATSGGQNIKPQVGEVTMMAGSLAADDIRKTFMALPFPQPSTVLFNLLGFLTDSARGVVRTTFDEYDKFSGQTPVGTAQMFIEQGLKTFGAVHSRLHRAMRRLLKQLYTINKRTLTNVKVVDTQGELTVAAADFQGPMNIKPVSDPRIFSDMQRMAQAQALSQRATMLPMIYDLKKVETNLVRQMGVADPDQFMIQTPQATRQNAVAENVTAMQGQPIDAYPGQDHSAHIAVHVAFLKSPLFGQNKGGAAVMIPIMLPHLVKHMALWYSDAMLEVATAAVRYKTGNPSIMLDSLMVEGTEVPLDRLMMELNDKVLQYAEQELGEVPEIIEEAQLLLKELAPPMPMDPSAVAAQDVQRQTVKDEKELKFKVIDLQAKREEKMEAEQTKRHKTEVDASLKAQQMSMEDERERERLRTEQINAERETQLQAAGVQVDQAGVAAKLETNEEDNRTAVEITRMQNESREKTAKEQAKVAKETAKARAKSTGGARGRLKTGTGQDPSNRTGG